jgi:hypothetical protein
MRTFTNPLDNIHVASPCPANWNEMYGNERKRFCGDCKLNVYNLSDMTRQEAENLLLNSAGRLCVRFFRRTDGTVLTKNCPVGWQAVKRRVSIVATAAFSVFAGLFTGVVGFNLLGRPSTHTMGSMPVHTMGDIAYPPTQGGISPATDSIDDENFNGPAIRGMVQFNTPVVKNRRETRTKSGQNNTGR